MKNSSDNTYRLTPQRLVKYLIIMGILWTMLMALSMFFHMRIEHNEPRKEPAILFVFLWAIGTTFIFIGGTRILYSVRQQIASEEKLKESQLRFQHLFDVSPLPYMSTNESGYIIDVNYTWLETLGGYEKEKVLERPLRNFVVVDYYDQFDDFLNQILTREKISGYELEMIRKDGSTFLASFECRKSMDPQRRLPLTLSTFHDVTEQKSAKQKLIASEERYRLLIENTIEGIVVIKDDRIQFCSKKIYLITEYKEKEIIGKLIDEIIHPEDLPLFTGTHHLKLYRGGFSPYSKFRIITKNRKTKWVECRTMAVDWEEQPATLSFINDISEKIMLEEQLFLSEKMSTIASLAAGVAHEINTPLSAILQSIRVIQGSFSDSHKESRRTAEECGIDLNNLQVFLTKMEIDFFMEGIRGAALKASKIINSLLDFSRPHQGEKIDTDINRVINSAIDLARADYDLKKRYGILAVDFLKDYQQELSHVMCIPMEIEQVILNLIKNAIQAMAENKTGRKPKIMIRTYSQDDKVCIEIEDNGPGIKKEIQQKIFDPFFTTKDVGFGTGLGLSVSYSIIKVNHRGTIRVESDEGKGAKFVITLPVALS